MKRQKMIYLAVILLILLLAGCQTKEKEPKKGPHLFYQNTDGTGLTRVEYEIKEDNAEDAIEAILKKLKENPKSIEMKSAFPKDVEVEEAVLEEKVLHLYMNGAYGELDEVEEVLLRAALVQSLMYVQEVDAVDMFVDNKPLTTKSGKIVGPMNADSFVRNTGTAFKSFQRTTLTLFFANKNGDSLVSEKVDVRYFSNVSMEKLVLEELMKGSDSKDLKNILPSDMKLLSTSVKDGICYVNFGKEFLSYAYDVSPEVVIYGIVNSIVSNCEASRVQISVEGESSAKFMESISLSEPFDRNIELVEKE